MNACQDGGVTDVDAVPEPLPVRAVDDVATLKVLADPTRLAILRELMTRSPRDLPVLSVKELAERLDEPQTKLYRHVNQLAASGLIVVAQTRIVSGIVEQRYRTGQLSLDLEPRLLGQHATTDDTSAMVTAAIDAFRMDMVTGLRAGRVRFDSDAPPGESYRRTAVANGLNRVRAAKAAEFRDRLGALMHEMAETEWDDDGVQINFLIVMYAPEEDRTESDSNG